MQNLDHDSDVFEEQQYSGFPDALQTIFNNSLIEAKNLQTNLNISVTDSENGRAVSKAMISIDSIARTAVCNQSGWVCVNSLPFGTYRLDIISPGFVAQSIVLNIHHSAMHEVRVQMISNI